MELVPWPLIRLLPVMGSPFRPVSNIVLLFDFSTAVAQRLKPSRATARQTLPCDTAVDLLSNVDINVVHCSAELNS